MNRSHVLQSIFRSLKPLLAIYASTLKTGQDGADQYDIHWPDGSIFASLKVLQGSVSLFVDLSENTLVPQKLVGNMDKQNIFHFSVNRKVYAVIVKELLRMVFESRFSTETEPSDIKRKQVATFDYLAL